MKFIQSLNIHNPAVNLDLIVSIRTEDIPRFDSEGTIDYVIEFNTDRHAVYWQFKTSEERARVYASILNRLPAELVLQ